MSINTWANLGYEIRKKKAKKIADVLGRRIDLRGLRILDIGTGAGVCADFFSNQVVGTQGFVAATDRTDQRLVKGNYYFEIVKGVELPFENNCFDVVISNHVIEHVGGFNEQSIHLKEISRVLEHGGYLYIAFPNRFAIIEPHYKLPFLSWLPQQLADRYVNWAGKGEYFNCQTPTRREFAKLLKGTDLSKTEITEEVLDYFVEKELAGFKQLVTKLLYPFATHLFMPIIPTLVHLAAKR